MSQRTRLVKHAMALQVKIAAEKIGEEGTSALRDLLAMLRAMHWNYWTMHWQSRGNPFYGDHLMFERIYTSIIDEIDGLAEKMVALIGPEAVDPVDSMSRAHKFEAVWAKTGDHAKRALASEAALQAAIKHTFDLLEKNGQLSLGLNDFLMGLANDHETNGYLAGQRNK